MNEPASFLGDGGKIGVRLPSHDWSSSLLANNVAAVVAALEAAGARFIAENGEGPGVRLRKAGGDNGAKA